MNRKSAKRVFRIIDNGVDEARPYALLNPEGEVIQVGDRPRRLADWAFDIEKADEVRHDEDLILADQRARE